jgi:hypothetical protein
VFGEALQQGLDTLLVRAGRINRPLLLQGAHLCAGWLFWRRYVRTWTQRCIDRPSRRLTSGRFGRNGRKIRKVLYVRDKVFYFTNFYVRSVRSLCLLYLLNAAGIWPESFGCTFFTTRSYVRFAEPWARGWPERAR